MRRVIGTVVVVGCGLAIVAGSMMYIGQFRVNGEPVYTDADTIRQPASSVEPRDVLWQPPTDLPNWINSEDDDYEPKLSADGRTLFFVRGKAGSNADIYFSTRSTEGWSRPEPLAAVNSPYEDLGPDPSPDGRSLYFYSNRPGGLGGYDIWVVHKSEAGQGGDAWSAPENLGPGVNTPLNDYGPALTPDGRFLYFASNRPRPTDAPQTTPEDNWPATIREDLFQRDYDLYVAPITDRGFGLAQPLDDLNSPFNEGAPAVSPVGDFLYFASDRPGGRGGFDLYRTRIVYGQHWPAENVGAPINTQANELDPALAMGGFELYFSSDRTPGLQDEGQEAQAVADNYNLLHSASREVFREYDTRKAEMDWRGLWDSIAPWIPWLLLLLLLLLFLLLMRRFWDSQRARDSWRKLSLLAKCLILSLAAHALLLALFTAWQVTTSLGELLHRPGGSMVAIVSRALGGDLAGQIRGGLADVEISPELTTDVSRRELAIQDAGSAPTMTSLAVSQVLASDEPMRQPDVERDSTPPLRESRLALRPAEPTDPPPGPDAATPTVTPPAPQAEDDLSISKMVSIGTNSARSDQAPTPEQSVRMTDLVPSDSPADSDSSIIDTVSTPGEARPSAALGQESSAVTPADLRLGPLSAATSAMPESRSEIQAEARLTAVAQSLRAVRPEAGASFDEVNQPSLARAEMSPVAVEADPGAESSFVDAAARSVGSDALATSEILHGEPSVRIATLPQSNLLPALPKPQPQQVAELATPIPANAIADSSNARRQSNVDEQTEAAASRFNALPITDHDSARLSDESLAATSESAFNSRSSDVRAADALTLGAISMQSISMPDHRLPTPQQNAAPETRIPRATETVTPTRRASVGPPADADADSYAAVTNLLAPSDQSGHPTADISLFEPDIKQREARSATEREIVRMPAEIDPATLTGRALARVHLPEESLPPAEHADPMAEKALAISSAGGLVHVRPDAGTLSEAVWEDSPSVRAVLLPSELEPDRLGDSTLLRGELRRPEARSHRQGDMGAGVIPLPGLPALSLLNVPDETGSKRVLFPQRAPEIRDVLVERGGGSDETEAAVAAALKWLADHQHEDGRWTGRHFDDTCQECGGEASFDFDTALTGLALLCFLGADHTPTAEGPYQDTVRRGVDWLLSRQKRNGDLRGGETMYNHGIATIALSEAYGMTGDPRLADPVRRAVRFIAQARHDSSAGGWRYDPGQAGDTSVLGWQIMALESARRSGIAMPPQIVGATSRWLDRVSSQRTRGLYSYRPDMPPSRSMTAEAMFVQQLIGMNRDNPRMQESADFLLESLPDWDGGESTYYWYYATLALFQHQGDDWEKWNEVLIGELLAHQHGESGRIAGSWDPHDRWSTIGGRVYQTAICTLSLEIYYRYLPLYLRKETTKAGPAGDRSADG